MHWPWSRARRQPAIVKRDNVVPFHRPRVVEVTILLDGMEAHSFRLKPHETREFTFASGMEGIALDRNDAGTLWRIIPWSELD